MPVDNRIVIIKIKIVLIKDVIGIWIAMIEQSNQLPVNMTLSIPVCSFVWRFSFSIFPE